MTLYEFDAAVRAEGYRVVVGLDEAGRGPLAGPVCAAAVVLSPECIIQGVNDSKKLTERRRESLYGEITERAESFGVGWASVDEIERLNILNAAQLAMRRALAICAEKISPELALIDGNVARGFEIPTRCVIHGDAVSASIAAASILAKVSRDRLMAELDARYPQYGFAKHKGYGTAAHYAAVAEFGLCPEHRPSFFKNHK